MIKESFFQSKAAPERSIRQLKLFALFFGIQAASFDKQSVLEIACGNGSNLIPQACYHKNLNFIGIDIDPLAIAEAQSAAASLNLSNINFICQDLKDFKADQKFDYIICHGLYTWCKKELRPIILEQINQYLNTNGICYLSYNTWPGWNTRKEIRDQLLQEVDLQQKPSEQISQAEKVLNKIASSKVQSGTYQDLVFVEEINNLQTRTPNLIYHELLAPNVDALNFAELIAELSSHNLKFVSEAAPRRNVTDWLQIQISNNEDWYNSYLELEKNSDQRLNRSFRGSLICHATTKLFAPNLPELISDLHLTSHLVTSDKIDFFADQNINFISNNFGQFPVSNKLLIASLLHLARAWPCSLSLKEILQLLEQSHNPISSNETKELKEELIKLFWRGALDLYVAELQCGKIKLSGESQLLENLRIEAQLRDWVTNARHEYVDLNYFQKLFLAENTLASPAIIKNFIKSKLLAGELHLKVDGSDISEDLLETHLNDLLNDVIKGLNEAALAK